MSRATTTVCNGGADCELPNEKSIFVYNFRVTDAPVIAVGQTRARHTYSP